MVFEQLHFAKTPNKIIDPFAKNLLDWRDETRNVQPKIPIPENDLRNQPKSDKKVKQSRENKS